MSKIVSPKGHQDSFSVVFYANLLKSKENSVKIYCRITVNRRKSEFYTNIEIPNSKWNFEKNSPKEIQTEDELYDIQSDLRKIRRRFIDADIHPSAKDIVEVYKGNDERLKGTRVLAYYENYYKSIKKLGELSDSTIKHYRVTFRILEQYLINNRRTDLQFEDLDLNFLKAFNEFLIVDYRTKEGNSIVRNTANKHHSRLKAIINRAIDDGICKYNPYDKFRLKFEKSERDRLTEEELQVFEELNFKNDERSQKILDIFLFTCYTGIRFQDGQDLTFNNVIKDGNDFSIDFKIGKTKEPITIPLIKKAVAIINKYQGKKKSDPVLPQFSNQKFNLYFIEIVRLSELGRHITHHVGRHTFATIALNNGIPLEVVQKILGQGSIRSTQIYAKMLPKTIREQMRKLE